MSAENAIIGKFGLDLSPLRDAARKAIGIVRGMSGQLKSVLSLTTRFIAPLAAALGLAFSAGKVKGVFDLVDGMDELSRKIGVSIEALLTMKGVFTDNGASVEMLGLAITKMRQAMESTRGVKVFEQLGLSIDSIRSMAPDKLFYLVGQRVAAIEDPMEKLTAAVTLFGRAGRELLPVISDPAFANLGTRSDKQARVMAQNAEALGAASDSFNHLLKVGRGFFVGVAVKLAPLWNAFANKMSKLDFVDMGAAVGQAMAVVVKVSAWYVKAMVSAGKAVVGAFKVGWAYTSRIAKAFAEPGKTFAQAMAVVVVMLRAAGAKLVEAFNQVKPILVLAVTTLEVALIKAVQVAVMALANGCAFAGSIIGKAFMAAEKYFGDVVTRVSSYFSQTFPLEMTSALGVFAEGFFATVRGVAEFLTKAFVSVKDILAGAAGLFVSFMYDGLKSVAAMFASALQTAVEKIMQAISHLPGLGHLAPKEPTSFAEKFSKNREGVGNALGGIDKAMGRLGEDSAAQVAKGVLSQGDLFSSIFGPIADSIKGAAGSIAGKVKDAWSDMTEGFDDFASSMESGSWASDALRDAQNRLKSAFEVVAKKGEELLGGGAHDAAAPASAAKRAAQPTSIWARPTKPGVSFVRRYGESQAAYEKRKERIKSGGKSAGKKQDTLKETNSLLEDIKNTMEEAWA